MKKSIYIVIAFLLMSVTWSCRSIKSTSEKNTATSKTDKKEVRNDSISNTLTNAEIKDRIVINVPETDNSELMEMFNSLLHRLNTSKTSGGNSYQMRYDEGTRQLIADIKVAATKFQDTKVTSDRLIETTFEEKTDAYFTKKIKAIPWWFYAIAVYLLRSHVINFLSFFIPGIKNIKTLRDLLKSP